MVLWNSSYLSAKKKLTSRSGEAQCGSIHHVCKAKGFYPPHAFPDFCPLNSQYPIACMEHCAAPGLDGICAWYCLQEGLLSPLQPTFPRPVVM